MRILLLGSGGYFPNRRRHTACLMIPEAGVVLDAGTAAFQIGDHLQTEELDIFLSHAHLDHVFGLTCLLNLFDGQGEDRIRVHGEQAKLDAVRTHLFSELLFPVAPPFRFVPLTNPTELRGGGTLKYFPLKHPGGSVGMRLEWPGHSLAYVTDTTASLTSDYIEQIRDVDLLIHEAYFDDNEAEFAELTGHSLVTQVAKVAAQAGAKRLALVHMNPMCDKDDPLDLSEARKAFPHLQVGFDGMELEF